MASMNLTRDVKYARRRYCRRRSRHINTEKKTRAHRRFRRREKEQVRNLRYDPEAEIFPCRPMTGRDI